MHFHVTVARIKKQLQNQNHIKHAISILVLLYLGVFFCIISLFHPTLKDSLHHISLLHPKTLIEVWPKYTHLPDDLFGVGEEKGCGVAQITCGSKHKEAALKNKPFRITN